MKKAGYIAGTLGVCFLLFALYAPQIFSHCQIPCGIYDDHMRVHMIAEHVTTIEKAMKQIDLLSKDPASNANQLVRWVTNKEQHAAELDDIVTKYFMTQRLKPAEEGDGQAYKDYIEQLTLLHQMLFYSMKCKQTTDLENPEKLREVLDKFEKAYFAEK